MASLPSTYSIWFPTGLRKLFHVAVSKDPQHDTAFPDDALAETAENPNIDELPATNAPALSAPGAKSPLPNPSTYGVYEDIRDPDAGPPTNLIHHFGRALWRFYCWNLSAEGIFCWKYTIMSIAFWLPSVFKNTAFFNYQQKGVWALIMAQTGLDVYGV